MGVFLSTLLCGSESREYKKTCKSKSNAMGMEMGYLMNVHGRRRRIGSRMNR